jgi:hypothetical protein
MGIETDLYSKVLLTEILLYTYIYYYPQKYRGTLPRPDMINCFAHKGVPGDTRRTINLPKHCQFLDCLASLPMEFLYGIYKCIFYTVNYNVYQLFFASNSAIQY